jgi:hypothetical protein
MSRFGAKVYGCRAALGAAAALAGFACSSSSSGVTAGNGVTAGTVDGGADASMGVAENFDAAFDGESTLTLKWQVTVQPATGFGYGDSGVGVNQGTGDAGLDDIPGAQVCVYDDATIPCVTTDANGSFVLAGLPPRTNLSVAVTKTGYSPILKPIRTGSAPMDGSSNPIRMTLTSDPQPPIGVPVSWSTTGQLAFFALGPSDAGGLAADIGASVTLAPSGGNGPFYVTSDGYFDTSATATEGGGIGYYYNVPPGNYTLTFMDPVNNCAPIDALFSGYGFPDPPTSVQFPIVAGYTTELVGVICTMKPLLVDAGQ